MDQKEKTLRFWTIVFFEGSGAMQLFVQSLVRNEKYPISSTLKLQKNKAYD